MRTGTLIVRCHHLEVLGQLSELRASGLLGKVPDVCSSESCNSMVIKIQPETFLASRCDHKLRGSSGMRAIPFPAWRTCFHGEVLHFPGEFVVGSLRSRRQACSSVVLSPERCLDLVETGA